jgi:class 3 adenylate cyclase
VCKEDRIYEYIGTLDSYVPAMITYRVATESAPITEPRTERFAGAVLCADISGFTTLAERGPAGAEELSPLLNAYFGELIKWIPAHGDDVVTVRRGFLVRRPAADEGLATMTSRAVQCGLAVQRRLNDSVSQELH